MAVFTKNEELQRQAQRIAMDKVSGVREIGLNVLGYKDTGEMNTWGKALSFIAPTSTARNIAASSLAKGTDTQDVLKEGRDNAIASDIGAIKFGADLATTIGTGGTGMGGAGSSLGSMFGSLGEGGLKNMFSGIGGNKETSSDDGITDDDVRPDAEKAQEDVNNTNVDIDMSTWKNKKQSEGFKFMDGNVYNPEGEMIGTEEDVYKSDSSSNVPVTNQEQEDNNEDPEGNEKKKVDLAKLLNIGQGNPVQSGMQLISTVQGSAIESEQEADKYMSRSRMSNFSYL